MLTELPSLGGVVEHESYVSRTQHRGPQLLEYVCLKKKKKSQGHAPQILTYLVWVGAQASTSLITLE